MLAIALHQLHDHLKSLRFQACLFTLALFFAANGALYVQKSGVVGRAIERLETDSSRSYERVTDLSAAVGNRYQFVLRPLGTEFIAEGGAQFFADTGTVNPSTGDGAASVRHGASNNNWMDRFEVLDWVLIARVVLSFLAIVMAYDSFTGERETGTLGLLMANPVSRISFLAGKFAANLVALVSTVVVGMLVSLIILSVTDSVVLNARIAAAAALFVLGSACYCALFLLLALGVSAWARTSATSLIVLVMIWAILIVALPQAGYIVGTRTSVPADWDKLRSHEQEIAASLSRDGVILRGTDEGRADNYALEREWAERMSREERVTQQMTRAFYALETQQYEATRRVNLLSPGFAFQGAVEALLTTGVMRHNAFSTAAWDYAGTLRDFLRGRDAADSASPHILFVPGYVSTTPVDHRDIPRFPGVDLTIADGISRGRDSISLLLLEVLAAFLFAVHAATRAPVVNQS